MDFTQVPAFVWSQAVWGSKGCSTTHELVALLHKWNKALDQRKCIWVFFVNFKKTFDHVDHTTVIQKFLQLGIPSSVTKWLALFLSNRQQRVKIPDVYSSWKCLHGGTPQDSWLGPLMFVVLTDDLRSDCSLYKFIDDTTYSEVLTISQISNTQKT